MCHKPTSFDLTKRLSRQDDEVRLAYFFVPIWALWSSVIRLRQRTLGKYSDVLFDVRWARASGGSEWVSLDRG